MHVGDLSFDELADQDFRIARHRSRRPEDVSTLGMPPPTSANPSTSNCLGETGNWSTSGLEHHPMMLDERQHLARSHCGTADKAAVGALILDRAFLAPFVRLQERVREVGGGDER